MERKRVITKDDIQFEVGSNEKSYYLRRAPKPNIGIKIKGIKGASNKILLKPHWHFANRSEYESIQCDIFDLIRKEFLELDSTKEKIAEIINKRCSKYDRIK
jgi:hypothetical protein